jgi:DnaK suppressor protein
MAQKSVTALARKALLKRSRDLLRPKLDRKAGPDEVLAGMDAAERRELEEIHAALERIERGRWGTCESCNTKIEQVLLEATPWRRTCRGCAGALADVPPIQVTIGSGPDEQPETDVEADAPAPRS